MDIQNDFSWSFSRAQVFDTCARRYYYRYYGFWGGWEADASEHARKAYLFSKMQSLPMLVGSGVHETLAEYLRSHQLGRPLADPVQNLRDRLNRAWVRSRDRRWEESGPKVAPPLFEHYYERPVDTDWLGRLRETALTSIQNFLNSDLHDVILSAGPKQWRAIEAMATVEIGGVPAFVTPDFAFDHEGDTWLIDWKTGTARDDQPLQMYAYAIFARDTWDRPVENLRAFDAFLAADELVEIDLTESRLNHASHEIEGSIDRMLAACVDADTNTANVASFAGIDDAAECGRCFFQEICDVKTGG